MKALRKIIKILAISGISIFIGGIFILSMFDGVFGGIIGRFLTELNASPIFALILLSFGFIGVISLVILSFIEKKPNIFPK